MIRIVVLSFLLCLPAARVAADLALVMIEHAACPWSNRWNVEVAPVYAATEEGRAAPLRRIDLYDPVPPDLALKGMPRLTPTFVLVRNGTEIDRIEGYPGEAFFWPMLSMMVTRAGGR